MDRTELRDRLFEKYFEVEDGIVLSDLMKNVSGIVQVWQELHEILEGHVEDFKWYDGMDTIKSIEYNGKEYLIIKFRFWKYLIIDLTTRQVLTDTDVKKIFKEEFFIDNFSEAKTGFGDDYIDMYYCLSYEGNLQALIAFYEENKKILNIPTYIYYKLMIGEAWTHFSIDLVEVVGAIQLSFQTKDQFLYETLFLNKDLSPSSMQDAVNQIGLEKMMEMFDRIKEIKIPEEYIPKELVALCDMAMNKNNGVLKLIKRK